MLQLAQVASLDVSAASGLVALPSALCVVADDELFLALYDFDGVPLRRVPLWPGELPQEHVERKRRKPDLEALAQLPDGRLLALGSGSTTQRCRGALIDPRDFSVRELDASGLYGALARELPELNIEGAAVSGSQLWLAQRGNGARAQNACIVLELAALLADLTAHAQLGAQLIAQIHPVALGNLDDVALGLTDLAAHPAGGVLFSAAAEASASTYDDGRCAGSVIGRLDVKARVQSFERVAPSCKLEGVTVARGALWLVADPDNRALRAPLYRTPLTF